MPFTLTHIIAVLPFWLCCRRICLTACIIGAMIPDFTLFFPISSYQFSHSWIGLLGYDLPAGMGVFLLYELLIKPALPTVLPAWLNMRLSHYCQSKTPLQAKVLLCAAVAIVFGSITHILWDAFSHKTGQAVLLFPWLSQTHQLFSYSLFGYKIIQYGSTLMGLPLLLIIIALRLRTTTPHANTSVTIKNRHIRIITLSLITLVPIFVFSGLAVSHVTTLNVLIGMTIRHSLAVELVIMTISSLIIKYCYPA